MINAFDIMSTSVPFKPPFSIFLSKFSYQTVLFVLFYGVYIPIYIPIQILAYNKATSSVALSNNIRGDVFHECAEPIASINNNDSLCDGIYVGTRCTLDMSVGRSWRSSCLFFVLLLLLDQENTVVYIACIKISQWL